MSKCCIGAIHVDSKVFDMNPLKRRECPPAREAREKHFAVLWQNMPSSPHSQPCPQKTLEYVCTLQGYKRL